MLLLFYKCSCEIILIMVHFSHLAIEFIVKTVAQMSHKETKKSYTPTRIFTHDSLCELCKFWNSTIGKLRISKVKNLAGPSKKSRAVTH